MPLNPLVFQKSHKNKVRSFELITSRQVFLVLAMCR